MSDDLQLVRDALEALNEGGVEAALRYFDPEIEWSTTGYFVEADTYRGHDGLRRYIGAFEAEFDDLRFELREVVRPGDPLVYRMALTVVGRHSRAPVTIELWIVGETRGGKMLRQRNFRSREEALAAVSR